MKNYFLIICRLEVQDQVQHGLFLVRTLRGLQTAASLWLLSVCACCREEGELVSMSINVRALTSTRIRTLILLDQGPTLMTLFYLRHLLRDIVSAHEPVKHIWLQQCMSGNGNAGNVKGRGQACVWKQRQHHWDSTWSSSDWTTPVVVGAAWFLLH